MNKDEARNYLDNIMITYGINQAEIAAKININRQYINAVYNGKKELSLKSISKLEKVFVKVDRTSQSPTVAIPYNGKYLYIDKSVLPSNLNFENLMFIDIAGDSLYPFYNDKDIILIDKSDNKFTDGNLYVFTVNDITYIRLINITPKQTKCIALNKEFDTFYLDTGDRVNVLGSVVSRIRL